jgi:hypothetical protein
MSATSATKKSVQLLLSNASIAIDIFVAMMCLPRSMDVSNWLGRMHGRIKLIGIWRKELRK